MKLANKLPQLAKLRAKPLFTSNIRGFAALSEHPGSINLSTVQPSDVAESSVRGVGALLSKMAEKGASVNEEEEVCLEINEFFRKQFRKISFEEAKQIVMGIGYSPVPYSEAPKTKIAGLDDKFWVWETLEEATRPHVEELTKEELEVFVNGWSVNMKGSEVVHMAQEDRMLYYFL